MLNSKGKDSKESVQVEETIKNYMCHECDFVGKTEPCLNVHKKAKHKETELRGYRKVNKTS